MKHYRDEWSMDLEEAIANQKVYDDSVNNKKYEFIRTFIKHLNDAKMYKSSYSVDCNEIFVIDIPDKYRNLDCIWVEPPGIDDIYQLHDKCRWGHINVNEFITIRVIRPRSYGCTFIVHFPYCAYISWEDNPSYLSTESRKIQKTFQKIIEATCDEMYRKGE